MTLDGSHAGRTVTDTMLSIGPIATVEARIAALRQRMSFTGPGSAATTTATLAEQSANALDVAPDPWASGFDPFGAAYQQALEDKATAAASSAGLLSGSGATYAQFAGGLGLESLGSSGTFGSSVGRIGGFGFGCRLVRLDGFGRREGVRGRGLCWIRWDVRLWGAVGMYLRGLLFEGGLMRVE